MLQASGCEVPHYTVSFTKRGQPNHVWGTDVHLSSSLVDPTWWDTLHLCIPYWYVFDWQIPKRLSARPLRPTWGSSSPENRQAIKTQTFVWCTSWTLRSAIALTKTFVIRGWLFLTATWRGVKPSFLRWALTSAPAAIRSFATSTCVQKAAWNNGVAPSSSLTWKGEKIRILTEREK